MPGLYGLSFLGLRVHVHVHFVEACSNWMRELQSVMCPAVKVSLLVKTAPVAKLFACRVLLFMKARCLALAPCFVLTTSIAFMSFHIYKFSYEEEFIQSGYGA